MGEQKIKNLLDKMWRDYLEISPQAQQIAKIFKQLGESIVNDHIAFRTYDLPEIDISKLATPFKTYGYHQAGEYHFSQKKLYAQHFEHENAEFPKIFISQLLVSEFPQNIRNMIQDLVDQMDKRETKREDFLSSGRPWKIDSASYETLAETSEYAAWVAAFGFRPNHFTISVNALDGFDDVEDVNKFLKTRGIALNTSGGEVKGSREVLLKQSSTLADQIEVAFSDKTMTIPSCYYEFAKRFHDSKGNLYQGFVSDSADKIFESTDRKQPVE